MARKGYPPEFRRCVVDFVESGRKVSAVAAELEVSEQTIYTCGDDRHALTTAEHDELAAAKRRTRHGAARGALPAVCPEPMV